MSDVENTENPGAAAEAIQEWSVWKPWVDGHTRNFQSLDNLVDGIALHRVKNAPVVGDVTLASSVRQIPRSSIQQLPTFGVEVNGTKNSIPAIVCDYLVRRVVFNEDTFGKGILSTLQIGAESALTHGFQTFIASLGNVMGDFGATMKMVHYNDIAIEPGIFDGNESIAHHVRTRVTRGRLKRILAAAKANPKSTWDAVAIQELLDAGPTADDTNKYVSEPRATYGGDNNTFDIIVRYHSGPFGDIMTYSPSIQKPLRTQKSKSKFGYPRLNFLVIDPAQLSPFGISRVLLASPTANYANIYLQSTAKMLLLNADPPVFQRGQFQEPVRLKRGVVWKGIDPDSDVKLQELSNSTLVQFRNVLEFVDNQIYSIMGVTPGATGAQQRGGAYKNTVESNMEKSASDLSSNQITNILENFLRQYALTGLDLFVSEQVGKTPLIIDDQAKDAINNLGESQFVPEIDPVTGLPTEYVPIVGDDNIIEIDWAKFYKDIQTWTVSIDLSMGKDTLDEKKRADIQDALTVMTQNANPNDPVDIARKRELEDRFLEKVVPDAKDIGKSAAMAAAAAPVAPAPSAPAGQ